MSTNRAFGNFEKFKEISLKMYVQVLFYFFPGNFLEIVCPGMYPHMEVESCYGTSCWILIIKSRVCIELWRQIFNNLLHH
jgi:hypothetical protein